MFISNDTKLNQKAMMPKANSSGAKSKQQWCPKQTAVEPKAMMPKANTTIFAANEPFFYGSPRQVDFISFLRAVQTQNGKTQNNIKQNESEQEDNKINKDGSGECE
ncbi:MAG: hypothetical protein GY928_12650 [Colwellia sp.]|nr:hypothetical protein [Colwellia sp.]